MEKFKVALMDLVHTSHGVHTMTMPLGIGMIGSYMMKELGECNIQVRLFKFPENILKEIKEWNPGMIGVSQYCWNSVLSLLMTKHIKAILPETLVVAGGPNLDTESDLKEAFLLKNGHVDFCVAYDGEIPMVDIAKRYLGGESVESIKERPVPGTYSIHPATRKLVQGESQPGRVSSLDEIPSPYLNGLFDEFYKYNVNPFVQTQRGCPFLCTYCHTSDPFYSKILFRSPANFEKELEVIAQHFKGMHDVVLYMANTNFGLYKQDIEIAKVIRKIQDKYDWPKHFNLNSGKNLPERVLQTCHVLKYRFKPSLSLQTLTPEVLNNINRQNIPFEKYLWFQKEKVRLNMRSETELILCLPGETKASFLNTLRKVVNANLDMIVVFTFMRLKGTPSATRESAAKYGYISKYRIVPRQFGKYLDELILETEEVIVGTNTLNFEEYIEIRRIVFVIEAVYNNDSFKEIKKWVNENGVELFDYVMAVYQAIQEVGGKTSEHLKLFTEETISELWDSPEDIYKFYSKPENYSMLCDGRRGDNLTRKYLTLAQHSGFDEWLDVAIDCASRLVASKNDNEKKDVLCQAGDIKQYISSVRSVAGIFEKNFKGIEKKLKFSYDIPEWSTGDKDLTHYRKDVSYDCVFTAGQVKELKSLLKRTADISLDIQLLYRDGSIHDFWPIVRRIGRYSAAQNTKKGDV